MNIKKIIPLILIIIVLCSLVLGSPTEVSDTHGISISSISVQILPHGLVLDAKLDLIVLSMTKPSISDATKCYGFYGNGTVFEVGDFIGDVCNFTNSVVIVDESRFYLMTNKEGANFNRIYGSGDPPPIIGTNVDFRGTSYILDTTPAEGETWDVTEGSTTTYEDLISLVTDNAPIEEDDNLGLITVIEPINSTGYFERDEFFVRANYSVDGVTNPDGVCNFTSLDITGSFVFKEGSIELNVTDKSHTFNVLEGFNGLNHDEYDFLVCQDGKKKKDLQMLINNVLFKTISKDVIPLCVNGFHQEFGNTTLYNNKRDVNITISCSGCDNKDKSYLIFEDPNNNHTFSYGRTFNTHSEPMHFNLTTELYEYIGHPYYFGSPLMNPYNITVNCNDTETTELIYTTSVNLTLDIAQINDINYYDGINIEYTCCTNVTIIPYGDIVTYIELNISYENGTVIKSVNTNYINVIGTDLNLDGIYNINVSARDNDNNTYYNNGYFVINDTVKPVITSTYPSSDNTTSIYVNESHALNILFNDLNLFAYQVKIYDPDSTLRYDINDSNIGVQSFSVDDSITFNSLGNWLIRATGTDSHTSLEIPDYEKDIKLKDKTIKFKFKSKDKDYNQIENNITIKYTGQYAVTGISTFKKKDRYNFIFEYNDKIKLPKYMQHKFNLYCDDVIYIENSEYTAHFVCPKSSNWVDFANENVIDYDVVRCGNDCMTVTLNTKSNKKLIFDSIGGLNIESKDYLVNVNSVPVLAEASYNFQSCTLDTTSDILRFSFLIGLVLLIFFMGEKTRIPILKIIGSIMVIFIGIKLMYCYTEFGIIVILTGIILLVNSGNSNR